MLQIIVVYFAPYYMFRMKMGPGYRFPAVIIAFVINYAAYFAEIYRSGIESVSYTHLAIDIGVAQYQIDKREEGAYVMLAGDDNKLASEQYAVGFKKGNEEDVYKRQIFNRCSNFCNTGTWYPS